jgi:hypothetical protein
MQRKRQSARIGSGKPVSLDHFIGGYQKRLWNAEAECLGGLKIKHELEFCWLQYGKIARRFTF